jgi:hypothetical protein
LLDAAGHGGMEWGAATRRRGGVGNGPTYWAEQPASP